MWWSLVAACLLAVSCRADDSLRPALQAVQQRQRDIAGPQPPLFYSRPMVYGDGQPEDIGYGYQKAVPGTSGVFETIAIPYSELGASYDPESVALQRMFPYAADIDKDDLSSVKRSIFRERGEGSDTNQLMFGEDQDDEGPIIIPSPFRERMGEKSRLQNAHAFVRNYAGLNKNTDDQLGEDDYMNVLNSIWEKYKAEEDPEDISEEDVEEILEYLANKEDRKRQYGGSYSNGYDFFNSPLAWAKRSLRNDGSHKRYQETLFDERYPYRGPQKRFPITKRSPSSINSNAISHRHKKNTPDKQTDPKVAAELSNIFQANQKKEQKNETKTTTTVAPNTTQVTGQKEQTIDVNALKPLDLKKKSINWSDYFGIDRRKKSADSVVNKEWLIKKYLEAYGMGKDKDMISIEKQKKRPDDIDNKMKAMEDLIVDQAIKYTGAHEGTTDSKEIQAVKDKVITELAAAYSLEKMRRALGEFKDSIAAQKASAPPSHSMPLPKSLESKRFSKEKAEHLSHGKMEKKESPEDNEIDFGAMPTRDCPILRGVEMRCRKISSLTGDTSEAFMPFCNLHHMCYICGPVLRAASPRECDQAFLEETESLCRDDTTCLYMARKTLTVARSLKPDPNLVCDWRNSPCLAQFLSLTTDKR